MPVFLAVRSPLATGHQHREGVLSNRRAATMAVGRVTQISLRRIEMLRCIKDIALIDHFVT
jgi:hypothetical protein